MAEEQVLNYEPAINTSPMAARNRPRNGAVKEDPDEELSMWNQIKKDLEKCSVIQQRSKEVSEKIVAMEEKMGKCMFTCYLKQRTCGNDPCLLSQLLLYLFHFHFLMLSTSCGIIWNAVHRACYTSTMPAYQSLLHMLSHSPVKAPLNSTIIL